MLFEKPKWAEGREMSEQNLRISPEDVHHPGERGFARLSPEKRREISKAASALGAAKGGSSPQTTAARLRKTGLLEWLVQPLSIDVEELKLSDAADVVGVSRQCLRRFVARYEITTRRQATAFMISKESLEMLHGKLQVELKDQLVLRLQQKRGTRNLMTIAEAAGILGKPISQVREMAENGTLRCFYGGGDVLLYASSVEARKKIHDSDALRQRGGKRRERSSTKWVFKF